MIAKLTGKLDRRYDTHVVLDVNGVGYALSCSHQTLRHLPQEGESCVLFVEPLIRAEHITLFGFIAEHERTLFRLLLTVQGVGGKVCLSILSALAPIQIQQAIVSQDHVPLTQADGVGPKLAQRIVRELKDKATFITDKISPMSSPVFVTVSSSLQQEAVSALVNLGYKKHDAVAAVCHITEQDSSADLSLTQLIPLALNQLAGG